MRQNALSLLFLLTLFCAADPLAAQTGSAVAIGRLLDLVTNEPIVDASVELVGEDIGAITTDQGIFRFEGLVGGEYTLRIRHLAYGVKEEQFTVEPAQTVALRIQLSVEAISLRPLVVTGRTEEEQRQRTRGTQANVVDRAEIEASIPSANHVGDVLTMHIPGLRVIEDPAQVGTPYCMEFRGKRSVIGVTGCRPPKVFIDGTQLLDLQQLWQYTHLDDIHRMELVPPAEAGLLYGTDSSDGVLLIETRLYAEMQQDRLPDELTRPATYDWSLELEGHSTWKVFGAAFVGNAAGLAVGLSVANRCIDFENLDRNAFNSDCGGWAAAGARLAAFAGPMLGSSLAARWAGTTDLSRGKFLYQLAASAIAIMPGYALAATSGDGGELNAASYALLGIGVPLAVTFSDKLFRKIIPR